MTRSVPSERSSDTVADELSRQRRLVDQMSTMHSVLRDRYRSQATAFTLSQLLASVLATAFAFAAGGDVVTLLGITAGRATWLGWLAIVIFAVTLADLVLDRRGEARRHEDAVRQLAGLKSEYRADPATDRLEEFGRKLTERYMAVMDGLPAVPERHFNQLKARYLLKVEISRYLSDHPGCSLRRARRSVRSQAGAPNQIHP